MDLVAECRRRSLDLLGRAATPDGFVASLADDHYGAVWVRDAAVACLGAHRSGDTDLMAAAERSIDTFFAGAAPNGRVPNTYWPAAARYDGGEAGSVDSTAWAVIAAADHVLSGGDTSPAVRWLPPARAAVAWMGGLDTGGLGLLDTAPATDWMDSSLSRWGKVLHINVLYCWARRALARLQGHPPGQEVAAARRRIDSWFWPEPGADFPARVDSYFPHAALPAAHAAAARRDRRHYLSHVAHASVVDRCDVLANLLAVLTGVPGPERAATVLDHLAAAAQPHPTRSWLEPVPGQGDPWAMRSLPGERYMPERWRNPPWEYHNAAAWPYVGGFHVTALATAGRVAEARSLLPRLAAANAVGDWGFHEWLHGRSGDPGGARDQVWNAGAYVLAAAAVDGGVEIP